MADRTCSVADCERPRRRYGLCGKHSHRWAKYGSTDLPPRQIEACSGPICDRPAGDSGLCRSHYKQHHLGKTLTPLLVATKDLGRPDTCSFEGCDRPHKARGYCKSHDQHIKSGKPPEPVRVLPGPGPCAVNDCGRDRIANGYCAKHNMNRLARWKMYGLTPEQGTAMWETQGRCCASCGDLTDLDAVHIDHDHECCIRGSCGSCVRGLLCRSCNLGLGQFRDDADRLRRAADYVERWEVTACQIASLPTA